MPLLLVTVLAQFDHAEGPRGSKSSSTGKSRDDIRDDVPYMKFWGVGSQEGESEKGAWLAYSSLGPHSPPGPQILAASG